MKKVNTLYWLIDIKDERDLKVKINNAIVKKNNYIKLLSDYGIEISYDINVVLHSYTELIFKDLFSNDKKAQLEFRNSLNPQNYVDKYVIDNKLDKNEMIEEFHKNLVDAFKLLGLDINEGVNYTIDMQFITFEDTKYSNFLEMNIDNFLENVRIYLNLPYMPDYSSEVMQSLNRGLFGIYDIKSHKKHQGYYDRCKKELDRRNSDYYKVIKKEIFEIE